MPKSATQDSEVKKYRIKWKNCDDSENSNEPKANVWGCKKVITSYWSDFKLKKQTEEKKMSDKRKKNKRKSDDKTIDVQPVSEMKTSEMMSQSEPKKTKNTLERTLTEEMIEASLSHIQDDEDECALVFDDI